MPRIGLHDKKDYRAEALVSLLGELDVETRLD